MSDQRPFGHDTLVIPFRGTLAPRRSSGRGMSRMRPLGKLYRGGVVNAPGASEVEDGAGLNPAKSSVAADPQQNGIKYLVDPPVVIPSPYATAAINYDPRSLELMPNAKLVEDQISRAAAAVAMAANGEFDQFSRQRAGSILHKRFADAIRALHIPGVSVEQTIAPGSEIQTCGQDGAIRSDVIYRDADGIPIAIWDFKTGEASLSRRRAQELAEYADGVAGTTDMARHIPVQEIRILLVPSP